MGRLVKPKKKIRISVAIGEEMRSWIDRIMEKGFFTITSHANYKALLKLGEEVKG